MRCLPALLGAILLLAGCAAPMPERGAAHGLTAREATTAFGVICASPGTAEAIGRAAGFGYRPVAREALPPALRRVADRDDTTVLLRPSGPGTALFLDDTPHCELLVIGSDPAALEQEFRPMLRDMAAVRGGPVAVGTPEQVAQMDRGQGLRLRQLAVLSAEGPAPRLVTLRVAADGTAAALVSRALPPGFGRPASQPKDPPPPR